MYDEFNCIYVKDDLMHLFTQMVLVYSTSICG